MFALLPKYNTDTVLVIVAAHKNLRTTNGLNPNSSVQELLGKYPNLKVVQNMENGWEYIVDEQIEWGFEFVTDEKTQIGEYQHAGEPSKPKRLTTKANWIVISN